MSSVLEEICDKKRAHIAQRKSDVPISVLEERAQQQTPPRGFIKALRDKTDAGEYGLIAEIKKASPSKGVIREDFDPPTLAQAYEAGGAACISVLTDEPYFQGKDEYLGQARSACNLPVLRKDFILDPYQVIEARAIGADCILLIIAALEKTAALELESMALALGMNVLVETHDRAELDIALDLQTPLIGINSRNLKTLDVDVNIISSLTDDIPADKIIVGESGLKTPDDLSGLSKSGVNCFLIGESLMRQNDVTQATQQLLTRC